MSGLGSTVLESTCGILSTLTSNSASITYDIPFYNDHAPNNSGNAKPYPLITYNVRNSKPFFSMNGTGIKFNCYAIVPLQLNVFAEEDDFANGQAIIDAIGDEFTGYDCATASNAYGKNFMCFYPNGDGYHFFESQNKVWHFINSFNIYIGE